MRLPLVGGSYSTRSIIASAQRCINYYPEINPRSAIVPLTHYQRPGLVPIRSVGKGPVRGLYRASNGVGYCVSGNELFVINSDFSVTNLGSIDEGRLNPVSMIDNGFQLVLVDGSTSGWVSDLGHLSFSQIVDMTGLFQGADKVDYIDTYVVFNQPASIFFGSSLSNQIMPFDGTFFAGKTDYPDKLETLIVNRHELILFGSLKSEVWYDAGNPLFPFAELPGAFIEHGVAAKYSVASQDISVYWLAQNLQGHGMVMQFRGYTTTRISNHALEDAIRKMAQTVGIDDAIGFTFQQDGHVFYMLTFPKGDATWVYDASVQDPTAAWHQEAWSDPKEGTLHRHRANCHAFINGINVVGDWQNGWLYQLDLDTYTDSVNLSKDHPASPDYLVASPIVCVRTFPHIGQARMAGTNQGVEVDGRRLQFSAFRADIECGLGPVTLGQIPAEISLRWSDDRGRTFGNDVLQSMGAPGEYLTQPQWLGIGIARDRIFELSHSIAGPAALNGAWVDAEVLSS